VVAQLVEALHFKPEGRGFDFQWGHWEFCPNATFSTKISHGIAQDEHGAWILAVDD
jgi:hypothetical protein